MNNIWTIILGRAGRGLPFSILHPYIHLIKILPNLNHPGGKNSILRESASCWVCLSFQQNWFSCSWTLGLRKADFFHWHLDILALYRKPMVPHHRRNFRRWKCPAKCQPRAASSVLPLLFHLGLWFTVGQNKDPKLLQRDMDTLGIFRPPMARHGSLMTWRALLSLHWIFVGEMCCHQQVPFAYILSPALRKKGKKARLQKCFNGAFESCQGFPSQHMPDPQGSTLVRCFHFL